MLDQVLEILKFSGVLISFFAVVIIVGGLTWALGRYVFRYYWADSGADFGELKIWLARPLTLGLEVLVLADVIETITVKPSFESLTVLAFLVLVRTLLNWTLTLEIEGRWPWQTRPAEQNNG